MFCSKCGAAAVAGLSFCNRCGAELAPKKRSHTSDVPEVQAYNSFKKSDPFPFILDELGPIRPTLKRMFGFVSIYVGEKLLCSLRDSPKRPGSNGMWLYTTREHVESLSREFPDLPKRQLWRSRSTENAWVIVASRLENFEEYAFKACELILNGDQRIGRLSRRQ